ncbi:MAG: hypothetical protein OEN02_09600 [Gammaproteobacteria bacterium]|nr:hypothetical protein [Gammaproteobacteria bacterium]
MNAAPYFVHCYDYGCKSTREIRYSAENWQQVRSIFEHDDRDAYREKQLIRQAVALMERISGAIAGTHQDKAGNYAGEDSAMQQDCIDESTNTFQYLVALEQLGLLKWHRVDTKQRRIVWFVAHWTATIREVGTGTRFAVDSWYRDNGEMPYLQPLEDWQRKLDFPAAYNPELAPGQALLQP